MMFTIHQTLNYQEPRRELDRKLCKWVMIIFYYAGLFWLGAVDGDARYAVFWVGTSNA